MSNAVYDLAIAAMLRSLRNLDAIVGKAEAHVEADKNLDAETLLRARLYPNMRPFLFQVQVATDTAKSVGRNTPERPTVRQAVTVLAGRGADVRRRACAARQGDRLPGGIHAC